MYTFSLTLALAALAAAAVPNVCEGDKATVGYCETISFKDTTTSSTNSPRVADCQRSCLTVLTDAGDWIVNFKGTNSYTTHFMPRLTQQSQASPMASNRLQSTTHAASALGALQVRSNLLYGCMMM